VYPNNLVTKGGAIVYASRDAIKMAIFHIITPTPTPLNFRHLPTPQVQDYYASRTIWHVWHMYV